MSLVARDAFGNLFLRDEAGQIHRLDVAIGKLSRLTDSEAQFRELASAKGVQCFAERDEGAAAAKGLTPDDTQCIGFGVPLVFRENTPDAAYIADLYDHVSFLGDLNRQIADLPDGAQVRLVIGPKPN